MGKTVVGDTKDVAAAVDWLLDNAGHQVPARLRSALEQIVPEYVAWRGDERVARRAAGHHAVRIESGLGPEASQPSSA